MQKRAQLEATLNYLRETDCLVVTKLNQLAKGSLLSPVWGQPGPQAGSVFEEHPFIAF